MCELQFTCLFGLDLSSAYLILEVIVDSKDGTSVVDLVETVNLLNNVLHFLVWVNAEAKDI